jgi:hypothetical protein
VLAARCGDRSRALANLVDAAQKDRLFAIIADPVEGTTAAIVECYTNPLNP